MIKQFNLTHKWDSNRYNPSGIRMDQAMKGSSTLPGSSEQESHHCGKYYSMFKIREKLNKRIMVLATPYHSTLPRSSEQESHHCGRYYLMFKIREKLNKRIMVLATPYYYYFISNFISCYNYYQISSQHTQSIRSSLLVDFIVLSHHIILMIQNIVNSTSLFLN